jgi:hypothetical protein
MSPVTFEDLLADPFQKEVIRFFEQRFGTPLPDDIRQFIVDLALGVQRDDRNELDWVRQALDAAEHIVADTAHPAEYPVFWLRLWSIVFEYHPRLESRRELVDAVDFYAPVLRALESLVDALSADERAVLRFMRHSHAHLYVGYVRYRSKTEPQQGFTVVPPSDPEAESLALDMIAAHDGSQSALAATYARKVVSYLRELAEAIEVASSK